MFGRLLSTAIKVVTLPVDAVEIVADTVTGGDGSRKNLRQALPLPSDVRDKIADAAKEVDE